MSSRDVVAVCCGRTRVNVCTACRRVLTEAGPLPKGISADELDEFRAFQAGLRWGFAIGYASAAFLACAIMLTGVMLRA